MYWTYSSLELIGTHWSLQTFILKYFQNINPYFIVLFPIFLFLNYYFFKRNIDKLKSRVAYLFIYIASFSVMLYISGLGFGSWLGVGISVIGFSILALLVVVILLSGSIFFSRIFTEKFQSKLITTFTAIIIAQIISLSLIYFLPKPSEYYASYTYELLSREARVENQKKMGELKNIIVYYFPREIEASSGTVIYGSLVTFECMERGKLIIQKRVASFSNETVVLDASTAHIESFQQSYATSFRLENQVVQININYSCVSSKNELRKFMESMKIEPKTSN